MLLNELHSSEVILDQLLNAGPDKGSLSKDGGEWLIVEFSNQCTKAREAWALAVFSGAEELSLQRYFTYHLQILSGLFGKLESMPVTASAACGHIHRETFNGVIEQELIDLTGHLLHFFSGYMDKSTPVPLAYTREYVVKFRSDIAGIADCMAFNTLPAPLTTVTLAYLDQMSNPKSRCSVGELLYFEKFVGGVKTALENPEAFADRLIELEFNHVEVLTWLHDDMIGSLTKTPTRKKITAIRRRSGMLRYYQTAEKDVYDRLLPPLSQMLAGWLDEEARLIADTHAKQLAALNPEFEKFSLGLSVAHLACLLRMFVKENISGAVPLTELFKFVSSVFSTKRAEVLSTGGLSKAYYSVTQVTAAEVRHLLTKMINRINQEYFPVLAAIGVLIYAC